MHLPIRRANAGCALLIALCAAGCGPRFVFNEKVEGTVKLDGKPLANVHVEFWPQLGPDVKVPSSAGHTDDDGRYQLTCENGKSGALVGKHKVVVLQGRTAVLPGETRPEGPPRKSGPPLPTAYTIASQTPLVVDVNETDSTYDLNLKR